MLNGVKYIRQSIDRIGVSVPYRAYFDIVSTLGKIKDTIVTHYSVIEVFEVAGSTVHCERYKDMHDVYNQRAYITMLQPSNQCQIKVRDAILSSSKGFVCMYKQFNPSLSQVEIASDFVVQEGCSVEEVQSWINHHISLKYSRKGSRKQYKDTLYVGKKGMVREGSKGIRTYDPSNKRKVDEQCVRVELQLNRGFLTKNINIDELPIKPDVCNVFRYVQFIADIDSKTVDNVIKKTLQNVSTNKNAVRIAIRKQLSNKLPARQQFDNLCKIKSKYNINVSKVPQSVFDINNFVVI